MVIKLRADNLWFASEPLQPAERHGNAWWTVRVAQCPVLPRVRNLRGELKL